MKVPRSEENAKYYVYYKKARGTSRSYTYEIWANSFFFFCSNACADCKVKPLLEYYSENSIPEIF